MIAAPRFERLERRLLAAVWTDSFTFTATDDQGATSEPATVTVHITDVPGDANADGRIDTLDLGVLASHWGQSGQWADGDFNGDGRIDLSDLGIMASNWPAGTMYAATAADSTASPTEARQAPPAAPGGVLAQLAAAGYRFPPRIPATLIRAALG
jgi:hypothetical protein